MEQVAKQDQSLTYIEITRQNDAIEKYRRLVFTLLGKLSGASIELVEGNDSYLFGEWDSPLTGQIVLHDTSFYKDVILSGSIGAAEAYIDGKWTSPDLTSVIQVMARNQQQLDEIERKMSWLSKLKSRFLHHKNLNTESGSKRNILAHYDLGNELYTRFLDPAMQYSCGIYSEQAPTLDKAQQLKMKTICERLELRVGDKVVEIGTGWGGLAIYMAQHYGCHVTTTTISDAQYQYAEDKIRQLGLSESITLLKLDYRKLTGSYDKLVSVEMIEAVGHEFLSTYLKKCSDLLKPDGKMLIQSITVADSRYEHYRNSVDFIQKYVFPGGCLPSVGIIAQQLAKSTDLVIHEMHDIGLHYARTLYDWRTGFESNWEQLVELGYDEQFKRLWQFYLCYCEGAFLQRVISTHHLVARKPCYRGGNDESFLNVR